ncbi:MAG: dienelactone hydrolase family protein [Verrucomicrobiota bacterium]
MYPENIHAYSALHGGRMVTELDDSPHLFLSKLKCEGYIGWASNDVDQNPEHLELYRESFANRGAENQIEVFKSALHGYFFPERPQYNKDAAETAWTKTLALFSDALTI